MKDREMHNYCRKLSCGAFEFKLSTNYLHYAHNAAVDSGAKFLRYFSTALQLDTARGFT